MLARPEPCPCGGDCYPDKIKEIRFTRRIKPKHPPRQRACCHLGKGLGTGTSSAAEGWGGLLVPVEGCPPPSPCRSSVPSPPNAAELASTVPASRCQLCRAVRAACHPSAEGGTCQRLGAGRAAPGTPLQEKVNGIIKKKNTQTSCFFLATLIFPSSV